MKKSVCHVVLFSAFVIACKNGNETGAPDAKKTTSVISSSSVAANSAIDAARVDVPTAPSLFSQPCRLIAINGEPVTAGDAGTLHSLDPAPSEFITFGRTTLTAKHTRTSREMSVRGPGKARMCVGGEEEIWLETGESMSVPGGGETPGSEVWIVTRAGVIRYPGGHVHVTATDDKTEIRAIAGAHLFPAAGATLHDLDGGTSSVDGDGWNKIVGEVELTKPGAPKIALEACLAQAKEARDIASTMMTDAGSLSVMAPRHMVSRRKARALCAIAMLVATGADAEKAKQGDLLWREVPAPAPHPK